MGLELIFSGWMVCCLVVVFGDDGLGAGIVVGVLVLPCCTSGLDQLVWYNGDKL